MELTENEMKQLSFEQLFEKILPIAEPVFEQYRYLILAGQDFEVLLKNELSQMMSFSCNDIDCTRFIQEKLTRSLQVKTKQLLQDPNKTFTIIKSYQQQVFPSSASVEAVIQAFQQFDVFLTTYTIVPTIDLFVNLLQENPSFQQAMQTIFSISQTEEDTSFFNEVFDSQTLHMALDAYDNFQNLELEKELEAPLEEDDDALQLPDNVKAYLQEIRKIPLLSLEEERTLAYQVLQGDTFARNTLIESNLRLVAYIARRYLSRGLSYLDLIQEGNLGLMKAVDKYDIEKGCHFATYASYWIKQSISRAVFDKGRNIRIPVYLYEKLVTYQKTTTLLQGKLNRYPTAFELADAMGVSVDEINELHDLQNDTISLHTLIGDDDAQELEVSIPSGEATPEEIALSLGLQQDVMNLLDSCHLTEREKDIVMKRYGFYQHRVISLTKLSEEYHLTRQRVRQIEEVALTKIRKSGQAEKLVNYLNYPEKSLENLTRLKVKGDKFFKQPKTIYHYFSDYTKEKVDLALSKLSIEEMKLLAMRYGDDLSGFSSVKLTKKQFSRLYNVVVPKMRKLLNDPDYLEKKEQRKTKKVRKTTYVQKRQEDYPITTEDSSCLLDLLNTDAFFQLQKALPMKEAIVLAFQSGCVNDKQFSIQAIAEFLKTDSKEVTEMTERALHICNEHHISLENLSSASDLKKENQKVLVKNI